MTGVLYRRCGTGPARSLPLAPLPSRRGWARAGLGCGRSRRPEPPGLGFPRLVGGAA
ncbi:MAG: hypothetical protein OZSIB_0468 [Candidatus Ozemobacter sibiricus]|uniref:Uncharacterized protein n=1 Tax=Candidatus Ozemobacter sibiricus TaxID=2268124 RepID=A0A367ZM39_9BACT|nr:MAG: hypothetical protein OZSIB_0468 [Candidatus Ozemobacter sibiricus]